MEYQSGPPPPGHAPAGARAHAHSRKSIREATQPEKGVLTREPGQSDMRDFGHDRHGHAPHKLFDGMTGLQIEPCILGRANRKVPIRYDADVYKQRNRIERMFGRLKDWRRIATRYDRCAHAFMSAICIAATVIFWL